MKQDTYLAWFSFLIGAPAWIIFFVFAGWEMAVLLLIMLWANNIDIHRRIKKDQKDRQQKS